MDERLALLLHPVRLRLVHAMRAAGALTTGELCARLPDLPKATVYRQVGRLVRGGVFHVESQRKVRGVTERRYRLDLAAAAVEADAGRAMSLDDHRRGFTAGMTALMADFGAYLDVEGASPFADEVTYRQFVVWMTPEERSQLIGDLGDKVRALSRNAPNPARDPFVLSTVLFPSPASPPPDRPRSPDDSRRGRC